MKNDLSHSLSLNDERREKLLKISLIVGQDYAGRLRILYVNYISPGNFQTKAKWRIPMHFDQMYQLPVLSPKQKLTHKRCLYLNEQIS